MLYNPEAEASTDAEVVAPSLTPDALQYDPPT